MDKTKTFDAVAVVRGIRDRIFEETKDLSAEERIVYFRRHGQKAASEEAVQVSEGKDSER